ncbi:prepilin-type N-terminal cleavage/methylation domain-containing protein [Bradyrhizobium sp. HKCCYLS2038]|uniref:prepilin-type N-terminal cleavage/methylation domain-containing protein n=1 Tax=unclassified Bradyrhizobium TaxID=2631580 RepID=UPI003EBBFC4D
MSTPADHSESGFTLIESLAAMTLLGLLISALLAITSQWLPNWDRGLRRIQHSESVSLALDRLSADIAASEFIRADGQTKSVLFDGSETSVTLARSALGPNGSRGLDVIHIAETPDRDGVALARTRATFAPANPIPRSFVDPVVLLRSPVRVSFAYAGADRIWQPTWHDADRLPTAVSLTVRDAGGRGERPITRIIAIHVSAPPDSVCRLGATQCNDAPVLTDPATGRLPVPSE